MKKVLEKAKTSILFYTIIFIVLFIVSHYVFKLFNIQYRQWVYYAAILVSIICFILGIFQIIRKKNKKIKVVFYSILGVILILMVIFWRFVLFILVFSYYPEHVIEKDDKKYVACVNSFLQVNVYYYDYINMFLVGNKIKIHEYYGKGGYDPFDGKHDDKKALKYYYYDNEGNVINTNDEYYYKKHVNEDINTVENNSEKTTSNELIEILYENKINDNTIIRVVNKGYILAQRCIIGIEKSTDGGKTWENKLKSPDGNMQIHNGTKFIFLDENIGFINDPGLAGTNGTNSELLVTVDGGETFTSSNIIYKNNNEEDNMYIDGLPYIENNVLKLNAYTIDYSKNKEKVYYTLYSIDNGLNWNINI